MSKVSKILFSALAITVASGGIVHAETQEPNRKGKKKATISRSGQIGSGGGFSFWGSGWGSGWNSRNSNRPNNSIYRELPRRNAESDSSAKIYTYAPDPLFLLADKKAKQPAQPRPVFSADAPAGYDPTPAELRGIKLDDHQSWIRAALLCQLPLKQLRVHRGVL